MARRVGWGVPAAAGAAVIVLALQACAGLPIPGVAGPREGVRGSASPPAGQGGGQTEQESGFNWVPFGPAEPQGPSAWYRSLEDGRCAGVKDTENSTLVQAVAAVCRAAFEHQRSQWAVAEQLSRQGLSDSNAAACLNTAARALVDRALSWHAGHPNADPVVFIARAGDPVACEFEITKVDPAEGPIGGGTAVEITGPGLNEVDKVLFGDVPVQPGNQRAEERDGAQVDVVSVTTPPGQRPGPVDVSVVNRAGVTTAKSAFIYTGAASAPPAPSISEAPAPVVPPGEPVYPSVPRPPRPDDGGNGGDGGDGGNGRGGRGGEPGNEPGDEPRNQPGDGPRNQPGDEYPDQPRNQPWNDQGDGQAE